MRPRWDADERGRGIGDAARLVAGAEELLAAMREPGWVAEEPEAHLLPHVERACASLPLALVASRSLDDATFEVDLRWQGRRADLRGTREAVFALLGSFAEGATYVRESRDGRTFEVVTGLLAPDTDFAPHGHTVRIRLVGER